MHLPTKKHEMIYFMLDLIVMTYIVLYNSHFFIIRYKEKSILGSYSMIKSKYVY